MIYIVEDDASIRELVIYTLQGAGYDAQGFAESQSFYEALEKQLPQLCILDIMLPGEDGMTILRRLRAGVNTRNIPVMMATAKGSEYDKVLGLDCGADDYLVKPFGMMEMISRVRALLRRAGYTQAEEAEKMELGALRIDLTTHEVWANDREVALTRKEFDLLALMMQSPQRVFSREVLLSRIWGYDFDGETRTVDVHVRTLRQKLGDAGEQIVTVRGVGYKVTADKPE